MALRVFDPQAPTRAGPLGIDAFGFDPAWVITGTVEPATENLRLEHIDGFVSDNAAGAIRLPVDGREVVLRGTTTPDGGLQITFAVTETYDIARADRLGMRTHCFGSRSGYSSIDSSHRPPSSLRGSLDADVSGSVGTGGASWENGR